MTCANAAPLFTGLKRASSFNKRIHITSGDAEDKYLRECRRKIRSALRKRFANFKPVLEDQASRMLLNEGRGVEFGKVMHSIQIVDIKFLTQGSHAYKTLIRPAFAGMQEIDLDDGIYFPMPFVDGRPLFASAGLFSVVRSALRQLVADEGWEFGKQKDTCLRIKLPKHHAHIDLPLFAVEESAFSTIKKNLEDRLGVALHAAASLNDELARFGMRDQRLTDSQILLAHRQEDWIVSDPKIIHDWFESKVDTHGSILRRVCRYLKAWRDMTWRTGGPSSIALMALAVAILDTLDVRASESRDDLLTQSVADELHDRILEGNITGPSSLPAFDIGWSDRAEIARSAQELAESLSSALFETSDKQTVVDILIERFGARFPNEPEAVLIDMSDQIDAFTEVAPATVAAPAVGNSVSA